MTFIRSCTIARDQRDFIVDFQPLGARFIRVLAHTIGNTPESHPGAGQPARMHIRGGFGSGSEV